MAELIIPDGVDAEQVQLIRYPIRLSQTQGATCWGMMVQKVIHIGAIPVTTSIVRFHSREDDMVRLITDKNVFDMPPGFHAMVHVTSTLLTLANSRDMAYEGDVLTPIDTKTLLQRYGDAYGEPDPNEVAKWYPEVCAFLSHKSFSHPETLEALIALLSLRADRKVQ